MSGDLSKQIDSGMLVRYGH